MCRNSTDYGNPSQIQNKMSSRHDATKIVPNTHVSALDWNPSSRATSNSIRVFVTVLPGVPSILNVGYSPAKAVEVAAGLSPNTHTVSGLDEGPGRYPKACTL